MLPGLGRFWRAAKAWFSQCSFPPLIGLPVIALPPISFFLLVRYNGAVYLCGFALGSWALVRIYQIKISCDSDGILIVRSLSSNTLKRFESVCIYSPSRARTQPVGKSSVGRTVAITFDGTRSLYASTYDWLPYLNLHQLSPVSMMSSVQHMALFVGWKKNLRMILLHSKIEISLKSVFGKVEFHQILLRCSVFYLYIWQII